MATPFCEEPSLSDLPSDKPASVTPSNLDPEKSRNNARHISEEFEHSSPRKIHGVSVRRSLCHLWALDFETDMASVDTCCHGHSV